MSVPPMWISSPSKDEDEEDEGRSAESQSWHMGIDGSAKGDFWGEDEGVHGRDQNECRDGWVVVGRELP